jgi:putative ABC transport system permease protein
MIVRQLIRRPGRAAATTVGIACAVAILVLPRFQIDAIEYLIEVSFGVADRQDLSVTFVEPRSAKTLYELRRIEGVVAAEPFRSVPVRMTHGHLAKRRGLLGLVRGARLSRPIDSALRPIAPPESGVLLSEQLARDLEAQPGDRIGVEVLEGKRPRLVVPVAGVAETFIGSPAYMEIGALNRTLDQGLVVSGAHLRIDPERRQTVYRALKDMPAVAGVTLRQESRAAFTQTMEENVGTFTGILTLFSCLVAVGVVYNSARISLAERSRDLASLRVLGFTQGEVAYILLGELALLTLLALPIGGALGYLLCWYMVTAFSSDMYQIPLVIHPASYGWAASVVLGAAVVTGFLVARNIARLDLVAALKTRE